MRTTGTAARKKNMTNEPLREKYIRWVLAAVACSSLLVLLGIMLFLFTEGLPFFASSSPGQFFFGLFWYPTSEPPEFGILPLIVGSLAVMLVAVCIAVPLGVLTAAYLTEIAAGGVRRLVKPLVELLAALPSVVIGFFGMVVVAPFLQETFDLSTGLNLFNAGLMLAFMSVPTICSIAEDALFAVPLSLREASLALGATRWETTARVVLPAALSGIGTAVMLGMSRAIGETMVVLMVAGGAAMIPGSPFDPVRPMPASIAAEMAEAPFRGRHYHALFATGLVLFLFTLCFNLLANAISERYKQTGSSSL
jgi:phosphate transport system permease protein